MPLHTDPAGGNPAGVVLAAAGLADLVMLAIAAEVGYSETAFVIDGDDTARRYRVRYFSPLAEVPFCGHATVATAVAIAGRNGPGPLVFETAVGEIAVDTRIDAGIPVATLTSVATRSPRWSRANWRPRWPRCAGPMGICTRISCRRWHLAVSNT